MYLLLGDVAPFLTPQLPQTLDTLVPEPPPLQQTLDSAASSLLQRQTAGAHCRLASGFLLLDKFFFFV